MQAFFILLLLASLAGLGLSLVRPQLLHRLLKLEWSRKRLSAAFGIAAVFFVILITNASPKGSVQGVVTDSQQKGSQSQAESTTPDKIQTSESQLYSIVRVVDGDTIDISLDNKTQRVRLIGLDTPEIVDSGSPVECFGLEASNKAKELMNGKKVKLEADPSQDNLDKYNRLLRYVFVGDLNVSKEMIRLGYAQEYTYNKPYKYQSEFKQAEVEAKAAKRGMWAEGACDSTAQVSPAPVLTPPITGQDKDCGDFKTQAEAQAYFKAGGGSPSYNFDRLDNDHDGVACESLP